MCIKPSVEPPPTVDPRPVSWPKQCAEVAPNAAEITASIPH